ncbi:uncharacterized protein LOC108428859 [Pygocentrus nattereri]|uniref:uncharacterized protein LOC108428859 n=1 Tax=Pygocentrus nattereri TaxID=42514 RepID=UPI0008145B15|nr:uncharacterized protein LOC108428859 [Pygocentrus nattereri]
MVDIKCTIRDYFRQGNKKNVKCDSSAELSFIPSLDREFPYLLGLEEVVHFRLQLLDKAVYNVPQMWNARGRKRRTNKKPPILYVAPSTPPKDPLICAECNTDFSCSWRQDTNGLFLCQSCFKCNWKKEHWSTSRPEETPIKSLSGISSPIPASSIQHVRNDPQVKQEGGLPLDNPSVSVSAKAQKLVPIMSACTMSPHNTSSSPLSSPNFYSDSSSYASLDLLSLPMDYSSSSYTSSLSDGSCSPYLPSSSDLYSPSSSLSLSPPCLPKCYLNKKAGAPYRMGTLLAKNLLKDDKVIQDEKAEMRKYNWNKPHYSEEKTEKTATSGSLSAASSSSTLESYRPNLQKAQVPNTGSGMLSKTSSTSILNTSKEKLELVEGRQQALESKSGCYEWKPDSLMSPQKHVIHSSRKDEPADACPAEGQTNPKDSTIYKAMSKEHKMDKWIQRQKIPNVSPTSMANIPPSSASLLDSQKVKVDHRKRSNSLPNKIPRKPK